MLVQRASKAGFSKHQSIFHHQLRKKPQKDRVSARCFHFKLKVNVAVFTFAFFPLCWLKTQTFYSSHCSNGICPFTERENH